jgi:hypothetical protein
MTELTRKLGGSERKMIAGEESHFYETDLNVPYNGSPSLGHMAFLDIDNEELKRQGRTHDLVFTRSGVYGGNGSLYSAHGYFGSDEQTQLRVAMRGGFLKLDAPHSKTAPAKMQLHYTGKTIDSPLPEGVEIEPILDFLVTFFENPKNYRKEDFAPSRVFGVWLKGGEIK